MYDPAVYSIANGQLAILAQGNNPNACTSKGIDSLFLTIRSATGSFTTPTKTGCPNLTAGYQRCVYSPTGQPGPLASPSVVKVGSKYYMAFSGGNADYIKGQIYWAVSNDGITWSVYNLHPPTGQLWTPIYPILYGDDCEIDNAGYGVGQLSLLYSSDTSLGPQGGFYIFLTYFHPASYLGGGLADTVAVRFDYSSSDTYGFGPNLRQVYQDGAWQPVATGLQWDYDNQPANGNTILRHNHCMTSMPVGGSDVELDPARGWYVRMYQYWYDGQLYWQETTNLRSGIWSTPKLIDVANLAPYNHEGLWFSRVCGTAPRPA